MSWWKFWEKEVPKQEEQDFASYIREMSETPTIQEKTLAKVECIEEKLDRCLKGLAKIGGRA